MGTPVIDPQKSTVWVVAWHAEGGTFTYRLHALNLKDGAERQPSVLIGGAPPDPAKPCAYPGGYNPCHQKQRTALLLSQGVIYIAFGGDGNRGGVFAHDAASLQQVAFWPSTPTGNDGGIWQSGQGPAADDDGNVYLVTGNGTFDASHRRRQLRRQLRQAAARERRARRQGLLHALQREVPVGHRPGLGLGRAGARSRHRPALERWQAGHRLPAVADEHGQVRPQPDRAGLHEPERRAGVPGHRSARAWGGHHLGPHPRLAGGLDGSRSIARLPLGRERHAESLQAAARQVRRARPAAEEHLPAAARHAWRHAGGFEQRHAGGNRNRLGGRAARRRRQYEPRRPGHPARARRAGRRTSAVDQRAVGTARPPGVVPEVHSADRCGRQGLRRDLRRQGDAARVRREHPAAAVTGALLRRGVRSAAASTSSQADS